MAPNLGLNPGHKCSPADHPPDIRLEQVIAGKLARPAARGAEERLFAVFGDAGCPDVLV